MRVARRHLTGSGRFADGDLVEDYTPVDVAELPARHDAPPVAGRELRVLRDTIFIILTALGYKPSQIRDVSQQLACSERHIRRRLDAAKEDVGGDEAEVLERVILTLRMKQGHYYAG